MRTRSGKRARQAVRITLPTGWSVTSFANAESSPNTHTSPGTEGEGCGPTWLSRPRHGARSCVGAVPPRVNVRSALPDWPGDVADVGTWGLNGDPAAGLAGASNAWSWRGPAPEYLRRSLRAARDAGMIPRSGGTGNGAGGRAGGFGAGFNGSLTLRAKVSQTQCNPVQDEATDC